MAETARPVRVPLRVLHFDGRNIFRLGRQPRFRAVRQKPFRQQDDRGIARTASRAASSAISKQSTVSPVHDRDRAFAVAPEHRLQQIGLFRLCRQTRAGSPRCTLIPIIGSSSVSAR